MSKKLVAYFSASGVTAKVAQTLAEAIDADVFEIALSCKGANLLDGKRFTTFVCYIENLKLLKTAGPGCFLAMEYVVA